MTRFPLSMITLLSGLLMMTGCADSADEPSGTQERHIELHGHRGARGLLPENTIPSFKRAIDEGATAIEIDVVVSQDRKIVVSHEPWFARTICSKPDGTPITAEEERSYNLYEMTYEEITQFDCGSRGHADFPEQQPMPATKPLLDSVIVAIEEYIEEQDLPPVHYNIEIKSNIDNVGRYHPPIEEFVTMVYDVMEPYDVFDRTNFQSFDVRTVQVTDSLYPDLQVALLVGNEGNLETDLERLGFVPNGYNPVHTIVDSTLVQAVHDRGMSIWAWTANDVESMRRLVDFGVDGIITDYPDRGRALLDSLGYRR